MNISNHTQQILASAGITDFSNSPDAVSPNFFPSRMESCPLTYFHLTSESAIQNIVNSGFKSRKELQPNNPNAFNSVSFALNSRLCRDYREIYGTTYNFIFAVKFTDVQLNSGAIRKDWAECIENFTAVNKAFYIHLDPLGNNSNLRIQPAIIGYCCIP